MPDEPSPMDPQETTVDTGHLPGSGEFSTPLNVPAGRDPAAIDDDLQTGASDSDDDSAVTSESQDPAPRPDAVRGDALNDEEDGPLGES